MPDRNDPRIRGTSRPLIHGLTSPDHVMRSATPDATRLNSRRDLCGRGGFSLRFLLRKRKKRVQRGRSLNFATVEVVAIDRRLSQVDPWAVCQEHNQFLHRVGDLLPLFTDKLPSLDCARVKWVALPADVTCSVRYQDSDLGNLTGSRLNGDAAWCLELAGMVGTARMLGR
ncbi:uncharacterized protein BO87DRAFT_449811 [Aspergillus neoniger CBS 115656]|uniref:Uncharacterized protein n=1 Tax=Aspergillus neoniger (strain CBS 115656) TaxID=1448310 RepID=A0A318Y3U0_ASPNB|nr:hypothetical protein BO87DRAFT_449811 [Aspergillus neoniger CBS 115656]PYH28965.1 hypothetical protein BO87DRAFT_449811 [Aspergillus neoniger CBS 115656]